MTNSNGNMLITLGVRDIEKSRVFTQAWGLR